MKQNLIRLIIIAPVLLFLTFAINRERSGSPQPQVLGSSVVFTVGDSGIVCNTTTYLNDPQTGELKEIDGSTVRGAPLGSTITYKTDCQNSGSQILTNVSLANSLSGQNQSYLNYKGTSDSDCSYQNNTFTCNIGSLQVGSHFNRSFTAEVPLEVPAVTQVTNITSVAADPNLSGNTTNDFLIFPRPLCNALRPNQDPIIVVENTPITLTADGTSYDNVSPIYTLSFGDVSADAKGTNSNFVHTYQRQTGELESTYFSYLRVSDSLGNETGDASNCSADCSKIIKVIGTLATKYCTCNSGAPSCSSEYGTRSCTTTADCAGSCDFYCDPAQASATPATGKSPLSVALSAGAGGSPNFPLTFKVYDGATLVKQETVSSGTYSTTLSLTNSTASVETHVLITNITDGSGKTTGNNCTSAVAVQPGGSGHYECQSNRCVFSAASGPSNCSSSSDCQVTRALTCSLSVVPAQGPAPMNAALTAACTGGTPPYKSFNFTLGDGSQLISAVPSINHVYQTIGRFRPSVLGTDSQNQNSPLAYADVLTSSTSAEVSGFHLECNATSKACEAVEGAGTDTCQTNTDCLKASGPAHSVCNKVRKTCESYFGYGPSSCSNNSGCQGLKNGYSLPTILTILLGGSLLVGGLVLIIKRV